MCGGFTCSKNTLTALNVMYILVGFILILVALYGRESALVTNLPIVSGMIGCGVFLMLVSVLGFFGAVKHNQVMLFFYMIILFLLFLVQFGVACACLGVSYVEEENLVAEGWRSVTMDVKDQVQKTFKCCGFDKNFYNDTDPMRHPACTPDPICCSGISGDACLCKSPCIGKILDTVDYAFKLCGGIGLFFCFTEFIGVWLTIRYRNQKDPRANPSAFL